MFKQRIPTEGNYLFLKITLSHVGGIDDSSGNVKHCAPVHALTESQVALCHCLPWAHRTALAGSHRHRQKDTVTFLDRKMV
jgi:hypothetical protein